MPEREEACRSTPLRYLRLAPVALAATLLNAAVETAGLSFITLYATKMGWTETAGMHLITTLMVGAIVLQLPIGWLADRLPARGLVLVLATLAAVGAWAAPAMFALPWLAFGAVFVWGGVFVGIYTVMLVAVGNRFKGAELIGIYAAMGLAWGAGALFGPTLAGFAMAWSPTDGPDRPDRPRLRRLRVPPGSARHCLRPRVRAGAGRLFRGLHLMPQLGRKLHQQVCRRLRDHGAGRENGPGPGGMERIVVLRRHDAANDDHDVGLGLGPRAPAAARAPASDGRQPAS